MKKLLYIFLFIGLSQLAISGNADREKNGSKVVAGKITDANGEIVSGAKIVIAETGETFFADMEGNYKLQIKTDREYSISINTIGYQPLVVKSGNLTAFSDLSLKEL